MIQGKLITLKNVVEDISMVPDDTRNTNHYTEIEDSDCVRLLRSSLKDLEANIIKLYNDMTMVSYEIRV